jgi:uncharacterized protein (DUF433 family)
MTMSETETAIAALLEQLQAPLYSYADADYLAATGRGTARRWLSVYRAGSPDAEKGPASFSHPASGAAWQPADGVSFLELLEVVAIGSLRQFGFTFPELRSVVQACRERYGAPFPLALEQFKTDGRELFAGQGGAFSGTLHSRAVRAWETVLSPFLDTIEYVYGIARRWWPLGLRGAIVVDPTVGFGLPAVRGSGIRTEIITERFQAGDLERPIEQIAEEFSISASDVEQALRFEISRLEKTRLAA